MKKVILVGAYPPPTGGIAVHLQRLSAILNKRFDINVLDPYRACHTNEVPDYVIACGGSITRRARLFFHLLVTRAELVHFHVSSLGVFGSFGGLLIRLRRGKSRVGMTVHSGSFPREVASASPFRRRRISDVVRQCDFLVAVNQDIANTLLKLGARAESIAVRPAFIPPQNDICPIREKEIRNLREDKRSVVVLSGYGLPLYGFHTLIDAVKSDRELVQGYSVVVCLYNTYDEEYVQNLKQSLEDLPSALLFRDLNPREFATVLGNADIYVRPTDRDGDAVAIREALWMGKSVIASDCVERPEGVTVFRTGDVADLREKLIAQRRSESADSRSSDYRRIADDWLNFYDGLVRGRGSYLEGRSSPSHPTD